MPSRLRELLPQSSSALIGILLAVLAVLVLAWVTFGLVRSGDEQGGQAADQEIVAQSQDSGADTPAPEAENRNVDSYAAYEAKDPFRQIVEPADTGEDIGSSDTGDGTSDGDTSGGVTSSGSSSDDSGNGSNGGSDTTDNDTGGNGSSGGSGSRGGSRGGQGSDPDRDGVSNKRERQLGLSPTNSDTDGDGIQDGADDSNGDGQPDRDVGGRNGGSGGDNGLFDSGGSLLPSGK